MSLHNRLTVLERQRQDNEPVAPALVLFIGMDGVTPEQQAQIDEAEAKGIKVICIHTVDASKS